jgi:hypothetical protein
MKAMRKCNDEIYQLAKDQALVKKLKSKRFRPFCLCLPDVMFATRRSKNSLFSVFILLSCRLAMEHLCVLQLDDFGRSKIYIIDHNPSWKENQRQKRESFWIRELQTKNNYKSTKRL